MLSTTHERDNPETFVFLYRWRQEIKPRVFNDGDRLLEFSHLLKALARDIQAQIPSQWQTIAWSYTLDWLVEASTLHYTKEILSNLEKFDNDQIELIEKNMKRLATFYSLPVELTNFLIVHTIQGLEQEFVNRLAPNIFDYILDYPDSLTKLLALRTIATPKYLDIVAHELIEQYYSKIFTVALATADIIIQIPVALDPLRVIDETGYLIYKLVLEFKNYLAHRQDFQTSLVTIFLQLMQDKDFKSVFASISTIGFEESEAWIFSKLPANWHGDPKVYDKNLEDESIPITYKCGTIFDILANMLGSADEFVQIYMEILAMELLECPDDVKLTIAIIESLKSKIYSPLWSSVDVMLRDYETSKQLHTTTTKVIVCSHHYWPSKLVEESDENAPPTTGEPNIRHTALISKFSELHPKKGIAFFQRHTRYKLAIEFENGKFYFIADPNQKTILIAIDNSIQPASPLSETEVESIQYWIRLGVLKRGDNYVYSLATTFNPNAISLCD